MKKTSSFAKEMEYKTMGKISKLLTVILLSLALFVFNGCSRTATTNTPQETLSSYFEAWEKADVATMYSCLSLKDQGILTEKEYIEQFDDFPFRPYTHQIISVKIKGKKAIAKVLLEIPSLENGTQNMESQQKSTPYYQETNFMGKTRMIFILVEENHIWKVDEGQTFNLSD